MLRSVLVFAKRFAVLVPGVAIAYLSVFQVFPWFDNHLHWAVAVLITYALGAYILLPALIRLVRIVFPPTHLPVYCVTSDGFASDPLNIALIGTRQEVIETMAAAGWHGADHITFRSVIRLCLSTIYGWDYPRAPMSNLYLFGRRQDAAFQIPITGGAAGSRHHVRFWAVNYKNGETLTVRSLRRHERQKHVRGDRLLWVGAASRDIGITFIRHNAQITHLVDSDTNAERDLIVQQLQSAELAELERTIKLGDPYKLTNIRGWRGHLHTDGRMSIMRITPRQAASPASTASPPPATPQSLAAQS